MQPAPTYRSHLFRMWLEQQTERRAVGRKVEQGVAERTENMAQVGARRLLRVIGPEQTGHQRPFMGTPCLNH